jgi:hypothetical protein
MERLANNGTESFMPQTLRTNVVSAFRLSSAIATHVFFYAVNPFFFDVLAWFSAESLAKPLFNGRHA